MALKVTKEEVWAAEIQDQPGGLADVIGPAAAAGANFEFMIARRQPDKPGTGVVFVTPVRGQKVREAARAGGLGPATNIATLKIEGPDRPGIVHQISRALGDAGVSMRGLSASAVGKKFVCFIGFDTAEAANIAAGVIKRLGKK
ncbi:MAG: ACT domain-containing protein [Verrucomicrobia bacterium]|nr:ACT domain-containing protein [Verrucomicrobiota bacterium]